MKELTPRQIEVLEVFRTFNREYRRPPSIREIGNLLGIRSPNGIIGHFRALQAKGFLTKGPGAWGRWTLAIGRDWETEAIALLRDVALDESGTSVCAFLAEYDRERKNNAGVRTGGERTEGERAMAACSSPQDVPQNGQTGVRP